MGARWNSLYRQKDIYFKQQEAQRKNIKKEPLFSRCGTSRTTKDNRVAQMELLMARVKGRHQEVRARMC